MNNRTYTSIAALAAIALLGGCNGSSSTPSTKPTATPAPTYQQIERLARPAVKEAFEPFAMHDTTNRSNPYNDPTLNTAVGTFMTGTAGRSAAISSFVQSVLAPDEIAADLSKTGPATYLGVETGGFTGSKFGGRKLEDDVVSLDLGAVFGNTLAALKLVADDGKESPCLTTDNVPSSPQAVTGAAFPYLQPPN